MKGRGVKTAKNTGDLLVTIDVVVPQNLGKEAEDAVNAFAAATAGIHLRGNLAAESGCSRSEFQQTGGWENARSAGGRAPWSIE